jgi:hypothetical protein
MANDGAPSGHAFAPTGPTLFATHTAAGAGQAAWGVRALRLSPDVQWRGNARPVVAYIEALAAAGRNSAQKASALGRRLVQLRLVEMEGEG